MMGLESFIKEIRERIAIGLIPVKIEMSEKIYINLLKMVSIDITGFKTYDGTVIDSRQELFGARIIVEENSGGMKEKACRIKYKDGSLEVIEITEKDKCKEDLEKAIVNLKNENARLKEIIIKLSAKL